LQEHSLSSVVAVDGPDSTQVVSPSLSRSVATDDPPSDDCDAADSAVLVRFIEGLPVWGGDARGEATAGLMTAIERKKSRYATGGEIGVFSSALITALMGPFCSRPGVNPADGRPADGRPAEGNASRHADLADNGVLTEKAERGMPSDTGKVDVRGVLSAGKAGLGCGMLRDCWRGVDEQSRDSSSQVND
jgi:hypothetical protein